MDDEVMRLRASLTEGIPSKLPEHPGLDQAVDHAPNRRQILNSEEKVLALQNALRYIPSEHHEAMAAEFLDELNTYGRIIMRRYRPVEYSMKAYPLSAYPAQCLQAASILSLIHI